MRSATLTSSSATLSFKLPVFEGPLDLLLHLIREHRVDIYDIPIAEITQQYLDYLALWESLDLAVAGEYLVIAATLVEIKSRLLLPAPPPMEDGEEPEDPRTELIQRLLEYQRYQGTVETLRGWEEFRRNLFFRGTLENPDDYVLPTPEGEMSVGALVAALRRLFAAAGVEDEPVSSVIPRRRVSLRMKMAEVLRRLKARPEGIGFGGLFEFPCYRYDIVLTFLAMLELLRLGRIRATQKRMEEDILITLVELVKACAQ